jgi:hypothetical protein
MHPSGLFNDKNFIVIWFLWNVDLFPKYTVLNPENRTLRGHRREILKPNIEWY